MTTGFIQPGSMDIFSFFFAWDPTKESGDFVVHLPAEWWGWEGRAAPRTPPKEHQSQHCCGTVGSFELSVQEEGAQRWMAHRMKPPFSQPCGNALLGLNNYSGPAQLRQNLHTRAKRGRQSWGREVCRGSLGKVLERNLFPDKSAVC